ncbi:MAG: VCBS repeat-containing protein, partial [Candidatus Krumholzibacteria bacterium]
MQHAPAIAKQPAGLDRTHRAVSLSNSTSHATLFSDVTSVSEISFVHTGLGDNDMQIGTGAAWFDYDRDGDLDLYVTRRVGANALFKNNGDGTFTEVAGP